MERDDFCGRVAFALGTGRCGTTFLYRVLSLEPSVASWHERHRFSDAFHRYCQWYSLPVDPAGFLAIREADIREDLAKRRVSFESNAYLAFSVLELYQRFDARFILLVRRPDKVVNSYIEKGWYAQPLVRSDLDLPPGYQPGARSRHHPLSRIAPIGPEAIRWEGYSRVGKLAWFWRSLNGRVLELFRELPETHWRVVRLEDLSLEEYHSIAVFLGIESSLTPKQYQSVVMERPNRSHRVVSAVDWDEKEAEEFEKEVSELAARFGYEWRVAALRKAATSVSENRKPPMKIRVKSRAREIVRSWKRGVQGRPVKRK